MDSLAISFDGHYKHFTLFTRKFLRFSTATMLGEERAYAIELHFEMNQSIHIQGGNEGMMIISGGGFGRSQFFFWFLSFSFSFLKKKNIFIFLKKIIIKSPPIVDGSATPGATK
jgi:hypothetical protein